MLHQIVLAFSFGKHWKEKHVTWARFGKKRDEDTRVGFTMRGDDVRISSDAVKVTTLRSHVGLLSGECLRGECYKAASCSSGLASSGLLTSGLNMWRVAPEASALLLSSDKNIWENVENDSGMVSDVNKGMTGIRYTYEFEHFRQKQRRNIQGYYVRFTKLIMTEKTSDDPMPRMQRNSNVKTPSVQQFPTQSSKEIAPQSSSQNHRTISADTLSMELGSSSTSNVIESLSNSIALQHQCYECDAFDTDVDEGPTTQTMFMTNLTSEDQIYGEAGTSYDSNTPSEVQDHDTFVNHFDEYQEVHEMQTDEQHNYVVDSDAELSSDSNIILYDHGGQSRLANKPDMIINESEASELARYKELVGEYEKWAKFELTNRERKIDEQMRIIILDRNKKETSLKSELHSAHNTPCSTVNNYKSKTEEVTLLKKDFKQKKDKFLEEFLDIKMLKDKIEDRLYKHDQSVQTVHMLCKTKIYFYDEKHKGHLLSLPSYTHVYRIRGYDELAEITRKGMMLTMQSLCVENKLLGLPPPTVLKENFLATLLPKKSRPRTDILVHRWTTIGKKAVTFAPKPNFSIDSVSPYPVKLVPRILPTKRIGAFNAKDVHALVASGLR
ncbi:hypothetical protein Tco_0610753 [Tanacetum coccineum]